MSLIVTIYRVFLRGVEEHEVDVLNRDTMEYIRNNSVDYYMTKAEATTEHHRRVRESLAKKAERRHDLLDEIKELEAEEEKLAEILETGGAR